MKWRKLGAVLLGGVCSWLSAAEPIEVLFLGHYAPREEQAPFQKLKGELARDGIRLYLNERGRATAYDTITPELLKQFQVVIFGGDPARQTDTRIDPEGARKFLAQLDDYSRSGGGVLWIPMSGDHWGTTWNESVGRRYGVQSLEEDIYDPEHEINLNPRSNQNFLRYYHTSAIEPHPVTEGVRGLLLPRIGEWSWPGTVPMRFGPDWRVLVRGPESMRTIGNLAATGSGEAKFSPERKGTYAAAPELIGVREASADRKGRMLVFPIYNCHTFLNYGSPVFNDALMKNGAANLPSDGYRLLVNAFRYLAEPARAAGFGGYKSIRKPQVENLEPFDWARTRFRTDRWSTNDHHQRAFQGVVGARTALTGGRGSVADWVRAAKAAELDFLFFLEDGARLDQQKLDQLVRECAECTDDTFFCSPGYRIRDTLGNALFMSQVTKAPDAKNLTPEGRLRSFGDVINQHSWRNLFGLYRLAQMPLDPQFFFLSSMAAPCTYEGGKLVDDGVARYFALEGTGHNYAPVSVVELDDPAQLAEALKTAHRTVVLGRTLRDVVPELERGMRHPAGCYVTNGPVIEFWGAHNASGNVFRPGANNFRLALAVSSPAGLREVRLTETVSGKLYRRYLPRGAKTFRATIDESISTQRALALEVIDLDGRTALAQPLLTLQNGNRLWPMSDRLMGMHHARVWDADHRQLLQVSGNLGQGITWIKQNHNSAGYAPGSYASQIRNVVYGIDGGKLYPASFGVDPAISGIEKREPAANAYRFRNRLASFDQAVIDYDGALQFVSRPERGDLAWCVYPETRPLELAEISARTWAVRPRLVTPGNLNVHEVTVKFLRDQQFREIDLAYIRRWDRNHDCTYSLKDAAGEFFETMPLDSKWSRRGELPPGGYLYPAGEIAGAVGVVNLGPQAFHYTADVNRSRIFFSGGGREFKKGETLVFRWLTFFYDYPQPPVADLKKLIADYGIAQERPGYRYTLTRGRLESTNFEMVVASEGGGVELEVGRYDLLNNLPLRVEGIAPNAVVGRYDRDRKQLLMLTPFEGGVRTAVNTTLGDTRLYVGELLHFEAPELVTSAVQDQADHLLVELHNPTDRELTCTVTGAPGFEPLQGLNRTVTIPAGESVRLELDTPPETLAFTPYAGDL